MPYILLPVKSPVLLLVLLMAFLFSAQCLAEPKVVTSFKYYSFNLHGVKTKREISSILTRETPILSNNIRYRGRANWRVSWKYTWHEKNNRCYIRSVSTTVRLIYTMPKALTLPRSKKLRHSYESYYEALWLHEKGHGEIAVRGAKAIEVQLAKMRKKGDCSGMSKSANSKAQEILRIYQAANRAYDTRTEHGETQGASIFAH